MLKQPWAIALVVVHICLALLYANATPYRTAGLVNHAPAQDIGSPDERQHANYVQTLLDGKGLPVFNVDAPDRYESYENHQPPLYYLLAAGWCKVVGVSDVAQPDSGMRLRAISALIGGATVAGAYFLALWGFERRDLATLAAGFVALLPMLAAIDGSFGNDALLFCLCTWAMALFALGVRQGWTWKRIVVAAALCGLAILTKSSAVALMPIAIYALYVRRESRPSLSQLATAVAVAAVLVAPWWLRNQRLYGDPLAIGAFNRAFEGSPKAETFIAAVGASGYWLDWVAWWTARSFFGVFGYMDLFLGDTLYRLLIAGTIVLLAGWLASFKLDEWRPTRQVQGLIGAFLAVTIILFVRFNAQYFQAQARYLFPAIGSIAAFLAIGLLSLCRGRWRLTAGLAAAILIGVNAYALNQLPTKFAERVSAASSGPGG